jgi:hypothetical protein
MFLIRHEALFQHDRPLVWNTDETQLNPSKRFRILYENGTMLLLTAMQQLPHITRFISISADGVVLKPVAILKNLHRLGYLSDLESHGLFILLMNGWITKELWTYCVLVFGVSK